MNNQDKIDLILEESKTINSDEASIELLQWLINNVENYVDNGTVKYSLDLILDATTAKSLPNLYKLQQLYVDIPEIKDSKTGPFDKEREEVYNVMKQATECRMKLNEISKEIFNNAIKKSEYLVNLFERIRFFYEKIIITNDRREKAYQLDKDIKDAYLQYEKENNSSKREEYKNKISALIEEGKKLIIYDELKGKINLTNFDYEAFNVAVNVGSDAQGNIKNYVIPEGFNVSFSVEFENKKNDMLNTKLRPTSVI